jgi:hypothetical protein
MPRNAADGQQTFFGDKGRDHVLELFRGMTVPRNPKMWQCLPALEQYKFKRKRKCRRLDRKIARLQGQADQKSIRRAQNLRRKRRQLGEKKLRAWQKKQNASPDDSPGYHRAIFDRVRSLVPERDRLATSLFQIASLRDPIGQAAFRDLEALYLKPSEVTHRPGLEPDKCHCRTKNIAWKHVYTCHKKFCTGIYGFAELCFHCDEWIMGAEPWSSHCQDHLNGERKFPVWCDYLLYSGVLAQPGHCPHCLFKPKLPASLRMFQFKDRRKWQDHIRRHDQDLRDGESTCPYSQPSCKQPFPSALYLQFHLKDAHGVPLAIERTERKRPREGSEDILPTRVKKQRREGNPGPCEDVGITRECTFVNATIETMSQRQERQSRTNFCYPTPIYCPDSPSAGTVEPSQSVTMPSPTFNENLIDLSLSPEVAILDNTPPTSVCTDDLIDPAILAEGTTHPSCEDFIDVDGMLGSNFSAVRMTQSAC